MDSPAAPAAPGPLATFPLDRRHRTAGVLSATAVADTYGDDVGRAGIIRLAVANPAILMLRGLPQGTRLDAFVFFQIFRFLALMAGLMNTFLAVRQRRAEEESGRAELLAATSASRNVPTIATLVHGSVANLVLCAAVAAGFTAGGLDPAGSLIAGAAVAATGLAFLGFGLLAAQFMRSGRGANAVSTSAVVLSYLLRGLGDALGTPQPDGVRMSAAWPSWFSPIGWHQQTAAYTANNPAPLLQGVGFAAVGSAVVFALQSHRDSGASLLPERAGRKDAPGPCPGPSAWLGGCNGPPWPGGALDPRPPASWPVPWPGLSNRRPGQIRPWEKPCEALCPPGTS
ncbi:hypothetical protein [Arthrobacter sp. Soil762]|uniref:hypothetical protein n=1 Tax=Arthrobacter sp. Soil762 TaxID=1736401 RepID=UPI000A4B40E5|nr:hypothetical protein [Arthrobacter sp. Soil762]